MRQLPNEGSYTSRKALWAEDLRPGRALPCLASRLFSPAFAGAWPPYVPCCRRKRSMNSSRRSPLVTWYDAGSSRLGCVSSIPAAREILIVRMHLGSVEAAACVPVAPARGACFHFSEVIRPCRRSALARITILASPLDAQNHYRASAYNSFQVCDHLASMTNVG